MLTLRLLFPGCASLKEKRSHIRPILARLRREFNLSVAEMSLLDAWQETEIACVAISNDAAILQRSMEKVILFVETQWPDFPIIDQKRELF